MNHLMNGIHRVDSLSSLPEIYESLVLDKDPGICILNTPESVARFSKQATQTPDDSMTLEFANHLFGKKRGEGSKLCMIVKWDAYL